MNYSELSELKRKKVHKLLNDCNVFWAFNKEQLREGIEKYNISKDNKMTSIGSGGYLPVKHAKKLQDGFKAINKWYSEQEKTIKVEIKKKRISYELYDDMLGVLPPIYHANGIFQVSEPHNHIMINGEEQATYATYQRKGNRYYSLGILSVSQVEQYTGVKSSNAHYFI